MYNRNVNYEGWIDHKFDINYLPVSTPLAFNSVNNSLSFSFFAEVWAHTPPPAVFESVPQTGPGLVLRDDESKVCGKEVGSGRAIGLCPNKLSENCRAFGKPRANVFILVEGIEAWREEMVVCSAVSYGLFRQLVNINRRWHLVAQHWVTNLFLNGCMVNQSNGGCG